ncbi:hypothetical protein Kpol_344p3 [Vanderwaltozyma polyspora DSM 70294]|uniref:Protein CMS1 n=1 Tax=Vanderwaltozyma polyspora (strain ATCC 22028 / DSM 70294 / BCRC 21397 / CBS 2163 / NBRC 10782 / NRRL Y-8283 / UCD 57-17) TaxID=436907 RepID=A7TSR9_VANPO|nr:uncharacterized protein Kpol_344p3 [Vanderwaltozyma polyspora DSM 70294]EDO14683.1 hypothetical protein Kpol_344p3 [Vanderwaltozyma polyspora DSM 70294]
MRCEDMLLLQLIIYLKGFYRIFLLLLSLKELTNSIVKMSNADDLDDGLVYDYESAGEITEEVSEDKNIENTIDEATNTSEKKRPIEDDILEEEEEKLSKRQKKLRKSKVHEKRKEQAIYLEEKLKSIPKGTNEEISDYFTTLIREKNPDLSALELEDIYLKKTDFISTAKFADKDRNLTNFPEFMSQFSKSPKAIIFSMSNIRVADVHRSLNGNKTSVKLFAKNKLKEDIDMVANVLGENNKKFKNLKYFITTPTRMEKLLENTDLFYAGKDKLDIILDASYLDPKKNSLIASENTALLCKVLKKILDNKSSVKILLY